MDKPIDDALFEDVMKRLNADIITLDQALTELTGKPEVSWNELHSFLNHKGGVDHVEP